MPIDYDCFEIITFHDDLDGSGAASAAGDHLQITFNLECNPVYEVWVEPEDSPSDRRLIPSPVHHRTINTRVCIPYGHVISGEAFKFLSGELTEWPMGQFLRRHVIEHALARAREEVRRAPPEILRTGRLDVNCAMTVTHRHVYDESSYLELMMIISMEGDAAAWMVPADEAAIGASLKRLTAAPDGDCTERCVVCLEEMECCGGDTVAMPCGHAFHGECIRQWLRTSHYCPICRYKMPTAR